MSEHSEQVALFAWAAYQSNSQPELATLFAVPNGAKLPYQRNENGQRYSREATHLKAEGLRSGVPDVWLPVPRNGRSGLVIEMKHGRNKTTPEQDTWLEMLAGHGWETAVCYSFEAARRAIEGYLGLGLE